MNGIHPLHGPLSLSAQSPASLGATSHAHDTRSIDLVADGFESMFMTQLLKEMRQTLEPNSLFGQDGGDVLGGLFDLYLGQHLAQANALGIGEMVKSQLLSKQTQSL